MNKEEAMLKIKDQLKKLMSFSAEAAPMEQVKCESMKCKDGSEIMIPDGSNLEPGVDCYTLDADGNQIACADGTYELENGQTVIVSGGKVETVSDATDKKVEESPENPANVTPEEMAAPAPTDEAAKEGETPEKEVVEISIEERVGKLEEHISQILELLQGMSNAQEMAMSKINEIAESPAEKSIKVGKSTSTGSSVSFGSVKSELEELKELRKKFNTDNSYNFSSKKA
jgi:hypothetical protein